jgi:hypothetical protein
MRLLSAGCIQVKERLAHTCFRFQKKESYSPEFCAVDCAFLNKLLALLTQNGVSPGFASTDRT